MGSEKNRQTNTRTATRPIKMCGSKKGPKIVLIHIKDEKGQLEINAQVFKEALLKITPAAQISEIRPELSGVLFDYQITLFKLAATDTFRLAEKSINDTQFKATFEQGFKTIIPLKTIQEVVRIFNDPDTLQIITDGSQILFRTEEVELISRLIDGEYPDYQTIIPKSIESEVILGRDQFINALKLASSFSGKINDVKIRIHNDKKAIEVYAANQNLGETEYLIPIKLKSGNFSEIIFNWRYLLDGLRTIGTSEVSFGLNGGAKPSVIKPIDDQSYLYILMPIKL